MHKIKCTVCDDIFESECDFKACPSCGSHNKKMRKLRFTIKRKNEFSECPSCGHEH